MADAFPPNANAPATNTSPLANKSPRELASRLLFVNERLKTSMLNKDYVAAARLKSERDKILNSPNGSQFITAIRASLVALGEDAIRLDPAIRARIQQILPESLEQELQGFGRSLKDLESRNNELFYLKQGLPRDMASGLARLHDVGPNRVDPSTDEFHELSFLNRLVNANPTDPAAVMAEWESAKSGAHTILGVNAVGADPSKPPSPVAINMAYHLYEVGNKVGWTPDVTAGFLQDGINAAKLPGVDPNDPHQAHRFAQTFVEAHAAAAAKTVGYAEAYKILRDHNLITAAADPREASIRVAAMAPVVNTLNSLGLSGDLMDIGVRQAASVAGVAGVAPVPPADLERLASEINGSLAREAMRAGNFGPLTPTDQAAALTSLAKIMPEGTLQLPASTEGQVRTLVAKQEQRQKLLARLVPDEPTHVKAAWHGALLQPEEAPESFLRAAKLFATDSTKFEEQVGFMPTGEDAQMLLAVAKLSPAGTPTKAYMAPEEAFQELVARMPGANGTWTGRKVEKQTRESLDRMARDVGAAFKEMFNRLEDGTTLGALEAYLENTKVTLGDRDVDFLQVVEASPWARAVVTDTLKQLEERGWNSGAAQIANVLAEPVSLLTDAIRATVDAVGGAALWAFGGKDASSNWRRDPQKFGRLVVDQLLTRGHFRVPSGTASLEFVTDADPERLPAGPVEIYGEKFETKTREDVASLVRFAREKLRAKARATYQTGGAENQFTRLDSAAKLLREKSAAEGQLAEIAARNPEAFDNAPPAASSSLQTLAGLGLVSPGLQTMHLQTLKHEQAKELELLRRETELLVAAVKRRPPNQETGEVKTLVTLATSMARNLDDPEVRAHYRDVINQLRALGYLASPRQNSGGATSDSVVQ